jgi:hypothetical protein
MILQKVTLEFDEEIWTAEGEEVERWDRFQSSVCALAQIHGMNPFQNEPIKWVKTKKEEG